MVCKRNNFNTKRLIYLGGVEESQEVCDASFGEFLDSGEAISVAKFFNRSPEATGRTAATLSESCNKFNLFYSKYK